MGWFDQQGVQGYVPPAPAGAPPMQGMGNFGDDPFAYTGGSLLTPWTQQFVAPPGSGGGYGAPEYQKFNFNDFNYNFKAPGAFGGQQDLQDPGKFQYGDFKGATPFTGVTAEDLAADPSMEFRRKAGEDALVNSAAAKGLGRSGGTMKALMDYNQGAASQEYGNVYQRKASEHDRAQAEAVTGYGTNRNNQAENFDRNAKNAQQVNAQNNASRLAGYSASSDVALRGGELGYNIATGTYDRNYAKARQGYDDEQSARNAAASAGSANANQAYNRALDEYKMNYDIFNNNQTTQYNRTMGMADIGMRASGAQAGYGGAYGNNMSDLYTGQGNAAAAAQLAKGQAWGGAISGIGNSVMQAYAATKPNYGGGRRTRDSGDD
jgi:hypothetical protein